MIAIALYISLGVVGTLLLVLLALPMIWRRAVRLTEKRITAEMPISYGELQAEKDMQRAEQAIELRRLEVLAETRHEEVSNQTLKIDNLNQKLASRDQTITERLAEIEDLQTALANQKQATADTEAKRQATAEELAGARTDIATLEEAKADIEQDFADTKATLQETIDERENHINEQKIELAAQMARIESDKQEINELNAKLTKESDLLAETKGLLAQKSSDYEHLKERQDKQQTKIDALQSELADKDSEIDTLTRRLERALEQSNATVDDSAERLEESEARRAEAEAKIASLSGQLEDQKKVEPDTSASDEQDTIIATLKQEKADLESTLKAAHQIIDRLDRKVKKQADKEAGKDNTRLSDTPLTSGEIALRNQMKSMAAIITEMAARQEGVKSPIPSLLKQADASIEKAAKGPEKDIPKTAPSESEMTASGDDHPATGQSNGKTTGQSDDQKADQAEAKADAPDTSAAATSTANIEAATPAQNPWEQVFSLTDRIKQMRKPGEDKKTAP
ncbi:hypothetical protein [Cohaesibacter intestini]|uniref:hypothetical protein n=1 Tax=Cohaesibacter intestini TaxID=2211145 RepID=UPI0013007B34|nr:hypothetical protein [Cohaesibacter intestini]